ncbi:MAG: hypothetical protein P4L80_04340 [Xanthobacteraceae bacterium]|nr:hypothetical protein [Xanthobacteraceae bacterium]
MNNAALISPCQLGRTAHIQFMASKRPTREDDLTRAREIVGEYGLLIGPAGKESEIIAKAVADGIALGRKEGIVMAQESIGRLKGEHDA